MPYSVDLAACLIQLTQSVSAQPPQLQPTPEPTSLFDSGSRIAFASDRDGNYDIYIMNSDGSEQTRLTNNPASDTQPTISPDGRKIAFISLRDGSDQIYVMNVDGSGVTRLTAGGESMLHSDPVWSPDGTKIAFSSIRSCRSGIYIMHADGTSATQLVAGKSLFEINQHPTWSPDSSKIAFESKRDGAPSGIYVMNTDGSDMGLLSAGLHGYQPICSSNSKWIAFCMDDGIYVMDVKGINKTQIVDNPNAYVEFSTRILHPTWNLDSNKIAFFSATAGTPSSEISTINLRWDWISPINFQQFRRQQPVLGSRAVKQ